MSAVNILAEGAVRIGDLMMESAGCQVFKAYFHNALVRAIKFKNKQQVELWTVTHPSFIHCFGLYRDFLIVQDMQFSLDSYRTLQKGLNEQLCFHVARIVAKGMDYLHSIGIPHERLGLDTVYINFNPDGSFTSRMVGLGDYPNPGFHDDRSLSASEASVDNYRGKASKFTKDVHDFGNLLYHLLSYGIPKSHYLPSLLENLIQRCKSSDPRKLPSFAYIVGVLDDILDGKVSMDISSPPLSVISSPVEEKKVSDQFTASHALLAELFGTPNAVTSMQFLKSLVRRFAKGKALDIRRLEDSFPSASVVLEHSFINSLIFPDIVHDKDSLVFNEEEKNAVVNFLSGFDASNTKAQTLLGQRLLKDPSKCHEAISWFTMAAEKDDPVAQYNLAHCYKHGIGINKNLTQAVYWLKEAAERGEATAQNDLGMCFFKGVGTEKDETLALKWVQKAAEQNHGMAAYNLGYFYENGLKVLPSNIAEALKWYNAAAELKNYPAFTRLGQLLIAGDKVERNVAQGAKYLKVAAREKELQACFELSKCYLNGIGVTQNTEKALYWLRVAAEGDLAAAQDALGDAYSEGKMVPLDIQKALGWYMKACSKHYCSSLFKVGLMYENGKGVPENDKKAVKYFAKAASYNHTLAMYHYAIHLIMGLGIDPNPAEGLKLLEKSSEMNEEQSQVRLGYLYMEGSEYFPEIKKDDTRALKYFEMACAHGNGEAASQIALIYMSMKPPNFEQALKYLTLGAQAGYPEAQYQLALFYRQEDYKDLEQCFFLLKQAAESNHLEAKVALGLCYWHGLGTEPSPIMAFEILKQAADNENAEAQHLIATAYTQGVGVHQNIYKAIEWYRKAAKQNYAPSQFCLARAYLTGQGVPQHIKHAEQYLHQSAEQNYPPSQTLLATLYITGRGVEQDPEMAFSLFLKAAEQDDVVAMNQVALCYLKGNGVPTNHKKAYEWFSKGADLGYEPCLTNKQQLEASRLQ